MDEDEILIIPYGDSPCEECNRTGQCENCGGAGKDCFCEGGKCATRDGPEEPVFDERAEAKRPLGRGNYREIPSVLVARLRRMSFE